jgi:quercetin dioxygenase-like cupin family protein
MNFLPACLAFLGVLASTPVLAGSLEDLIDSGTLPKNPRTPLAVTPLLSRVLDGNTETSTFLVHRAARTRTPIHSHDSGGLTCLVQGEMTLYIENQKPLQIKTPGCFYMPSGKRMIGYNSGNSTAILYDTFEGKIGFSHWSIQEGEHKASFHGQFGDGR